MFRFDKGINKGLQAKLQERQAAKQAAREEKAEARESAMNEMLDAANTQRNIAVYFNQQFREYPGYQMSIRQKDGAGSVSLHEPATVLPDMIAAIQNTKGLFIEGHVRDKKGLIKDIYDSDHPGEIRREKYGVRDILKTCDLEAYEQQRLKPKHSYGPSYRVLAVDDLSDVGLTGASESQLE